MGPAPAKPTLEALQELDEEATLAGVVGVGTPPRQTTAVGAGMGTPSRTATPLAPRHSPHIRREVIAEVHLLIDDLEEDSRTWMAARPSWVRGHLFDAGQAGAHTGARIFGASTPVGLPGHGGDHRGHDRRLPDARRDSGQDLAGDAATTAKYQNPVPIADLVATNADYVRRKVPHGEGWRAF